MTQVIRLKRPSDYRTEQGARFEKARPLVASLTVDENGASWNWQDQELTPRELAFAMLSSGAGAQDLQEELDISRSHAFRLQKQFREGGSALPVT